MVHTLLMQKGVFRRGRCAINFGLAEARQLYSRQTNPTTSSMNQHTLTGLQPSPEI
jgi:O-acetylhomoserine/O-acetylserine sulfhydrylase-like pyridoxal-dependent enzyme